MQKWRKCVTQTLAHQKIKIRRERWRKPSNLLYSGRHIHARNFMQPDTPDGTFLKSVGFTSCIYLEKRPWKVFLAGGGGGVQILKKEIGMWPDEHSVYCVQNPVGFFFLLPVWPVGNSLMPSIGARDNTRHVSTPCVSHVTARRLKRLLPKPVGSKGKNIVFPRQENSALFLLLLMRKCENSDKTATFT